VGYREIGQAKDKEGEGGQIRPETGEGFRELR